MRREIITDSEVVCAAVSHSEFFAQVQFSDLGIFGQLSGQSRPEDFAFSHDVGPVCYTEGFSDVMIGDQKPDTSITQIEYYILNVVDGFRIDTGKRLIQQYILRFGCECSRNLGSSSFTT